MFALTKDNRILDRVQWLMRQYRLPTTHTPPFPFPSLTSFCRVQLSSSALGCKVGSKSESVGCTLWLYEDIRNAKRFLFASCLPHLLADLPSLFPLLLPPALVLINSIALHFRGNCQLCVDLCKFAQLLSECIQRTHTLTHTHR